jgi:putative nucleotidyltransferase with HDIG domain
MIKDFGLGVSLDIKADEFVKFYLKLVNRNLNHLGTHSENTASVSLSLAKSMGYKGDDIKLLKYGSLLHDIGKLFTPAEILNSSRALTSIEFEIIKTHTIYGYEVLEGFKSFPSDLKYFAVKHHYRQGFGYPKHLMYDNGVDQTLIDILTVADSFSAIMEPRVYKNNVSAKNTFEIMSDETNDKNKGLNKDVLEHLKYLIDNEKIDLKGFFND